MNNKEEKALVPASGAKVESAGYWTKISRVYTIIFRALLFVLPLFVIVFMAICAQAFTRNSVFGFGNDLLSVSSFLSSDYQTVYYTYEEGEREVLVYRDGVAVVTTDGIEIYSPDGERLLERSMVLDAPRAVASAKYLVVYDFGATAFAVTNGYTVLFEGKTEFPILGATVSDTGHFALITESDTHLSQVLLYDANFNLAQRFSRNSATTGVCISANGKYIAFCGITTENGTVQSVAELYRIGAKQSAFSTRVEDVALSVAFSDTRHLVMVTAKGGYVFDTDGEQLSHVDFGGVTLVGYDVNENGCAFLLDVGGVRAQSRVLVCDERGNLLSEKSFDTDLKAVALAQDHAYLLGEDALLRVSLGKDRTDTLAVQTGATGILLTKEGQLRLVYAAAAEYVEFD